MEQSGNNSGNAGSFKRDWLDLVLFIATLVAFVSLVVREVHDPDTWWQVAIGRDILANLAVPRYDHFAAAAFGRSYHDSHWLFQVLLGIADRLAEMRGVGLVMVVIWSATILSCYRATRRWLDPAASCVIIFLVILACSERFNSRPEILTYLMVSLFTLRFQEHRFTSFRDCTLLVVFQIVWSNSHGLFVIGPFIAGCYFLGSVFRKIRTGHDDDLSATAIITALLIGASLVSPFGIDGWRYALLLMTEAGPNGPALFKLLDELQPALSVKRLSYPDFWPFILLLLSLLMTTIPLALKGKVSYPRLLIASALCLTAATGARNIPLFAVTAGPLVAENLKKLFPELAFSSTIGRAVVASTLLVFSWFPLSGRYYEMLGYDIRYGLGITTSFYPVRLPDFLRKIKFTGQIYNANYLGGFCLYHGFLPLVDSRWEVYDERVLDRINRARTNAQEWEWVIATYDIRGILLPTWNLQDKELFYRVYYDKRWQLVYQDDAVFFWVRADMTS